MYEYISGFFLSQIFFVTNEQLGCTFNADIVIIYLKTELC
jgi:hypothetical protein